MKKTNPIKEELKQLAQQIKESKLELKDKQRNHTAVWKDYSKVYNLKSSFRHRHIAYCLIKGKSYEQIEKPKEGNEPDFDLIENYKKEITEILNKYYGALKEKEEKKEKIEMN